MDLGRGSHEREGCLLAQNSQVVFAQDSSNRHVAIELVRADTDEYHVLRFLHEQSMDTLEENCVIPVLDLLPTDGYWFAVMPRWGTEAYNPVFTLLAEALDLVHGMLKGLVFLHKNNIAHGDIAVHNILVNHFSDFRTMRYSSWRAKLRGERRLSYALKFDFDDSTVFPRTADKRECRLPYHKSWGTFSIGVGDTDAGEYDYDPFAFDVAGMGVQLRDLYNYLTPIFPAFVPLFNTMTTWDVSRRFRATQALEFFESQMSELPETQLGRYIDNELEGYIPDPCLRILRKSGRCIKYRYPNLGLVDCFAGSLADGGCGISSPGYVGSASNFSLRPPVKFIGGFVPRESLFDIRLDSSCGFP